MKYVATNMYKQLDNLESTKQFFEIQNAFIRDNT